MKQTFSRHRALAAIMLLVLGCGVLRAQDTTACRITGRILSVEPGGRSVIVNRGSTVAVMVDSACTVEAHGDTGQVPASFVSTVKDIYEDSARVILDTDSAGVAAGDLCHLYAHIPEIVAQSPVGRMAMHDIIFVDFYEGQPLCTLGELVRSPRPEKLDMILQRFLNELYDQAEMGERGEGTVKSGFYDGMTVPEAFAYTDGHKLELFFRYVSEQTDVYSGKNLIFIDVFAAWVEAGTPVPVSHKDR